MIRRLLVANRGEIARRVLATCRRLDVETVAVFSDPDAGAAHAREAGAAVRLPGAAPADTYLRADLLLAAARATGADAVHPGYGFLSEQAPFARAVLDAGLTWVGPSPGTIEAMGNKVRAKALMTAAGVPTLPGLDPGAVAEADLPVLVKASAGGGGRGMRVVRALDDLARQVACARREAGSAFGDDTVFCEPYLERGRHLEVQVLADGHGTLWALGERECSIQRRHQKIVEETPAPGVGDELRGRLVAAAVAAARAIGYLGAGTVEFLATADGRLHFLEMNTRLQVEHPVTECVFGLDLVALQLLVAEGGALPEQPPAPSGSAIEARVYAEDPAAGWFPSSGRLDALEVPGVDAEFAPPAGPGIRLDAGYVGGDVVGVHYDPLIAKVIAWAPTRSEAVRRLASALARARVHGPVTDRDLLVRVLRHDAFLAGEVDTGFLDRHDLTRPLAYDAAVELSALAAALADSCRRRADARPRLPAGWRNVPSQLATATYAYGERKLAVGYRVDRDGLTVGGLDLGEVGLVAAAPDAVTLTVDGVDRRFAVARGEDDRVYVDSALGAVTLRAVPRFADPADRTAAGSLLAPMPGTVSAVLAADGDRVAAGQPLLVLDAMKMEHPITAPAPGVVEHLAVKVGDQVDTGAVLAVVAAGDPD